jgi:hypothetical protein
MHNEFHVLVIIIEKQSRTVERKVRILDRRQKEPKGVSHTKNKTTEYTFLLNSPKGKRRIKGRISQQLSLCWIIQIAEK